MRASCSSLAIAVGLNKQSAFCKNYMYTSYLLQQQKNPKISDSPTAGLIALYARN